MILTFECPHCKNFYEIEEDGLGAPIDCPTCGQQALAGQGKPPTVDSAPPKKDPPKRDDAAAILAKEFICVDCGAMGKGKIRGSAYTEVLLWVPWLFLFNVLATTYGVGWVSHIVLASMLGPCLAGPVYTSWRRIGQSCKDCHGKLIRIGSPRGVKLADTLHLTPYK